MKTENTTKIILATLTGVASGAILGMLLAPDKGSTTRKKISKTGDNYLKNIKKDIEELRKYLNKRAESTKKEVNQLGQNAKYKGEQVLNKAKKMASYDEWTKEELYERAKEASIDGYSQMNKDELIEALKKH